VDYLFFFVGLGVGAGGLTAGFSGSAPSDPSALSAESRATNASEIFESLALV
jgi:hypothetical protein